MLIINTGRLITTVETENSAAFIPSPWKAYPLFGEIVAELSSAVLSRLVGQQTENLGQHYQYINRYAQKANKNILSACLTVLNETEQVLNLILDTAKQIH